jgi:hypothetical protein
VAIFTQPFAQKPAKAEAVFNQQDSHLIPSPQPPRALVRRYVPCVCARSPNVLLDAPCLVFSKKHQITQHPTAPIRTIRR